MPMPMPPYYAVIFASQRTPVDAGYAEMARRMVALAAQQPGFLGQDSARDVDGLGITVSYWDSLQAIANWKANAEHAVAQALGKNRWYSAYSLRIARLERAYAFDADTVSSESA